MTQLPAPIPQSASDIWSRFSADPRVHTATRASDADRDVAASAIGDAFADGRLQMSEHEERLDGAMNAKTLGELVPLVKDITVESAPRSFVAAVAQPRVRSAAFASWLGLVVMFNVIWLLTVVSSGHVNYYWPMWPMAATAIPMILARLSGGDASGRHQRRIQRRRSRHGGPSALDS